MKKKNSEPDCASKRTISATWFLDCWQIPKKIADCARLNTISRCAASHSCGVLTMTRLKWSLYTAIIASGSCLLCRLRDRTMCCGRFEVFFHPEILAFSLAFSNHFLCWYCGHWKVKHFAAKLLLHHGQTGCRSYRCAKNHYLLVSSLLAPSTTSQSFLFG